MATADLLARLLAFPAWLAPAMMAAADPEQATRMMEQALRDTLGDLLTTEAEEPS